MLVTNSKQKFLGKFSEIIERYPAPLSCSIILTLLLICDELGILNFGHMLKEDIQIAFSTAFMASGALSLYLNAKDNISPQLKHGLTAALAVFVISLGLVSSWFQQSPMFLYPGLGLLLMAAPFFFKRTNENSVWLYNSRYAIAIAMSIIASLLFGGGLYVISSSLDFLLGIDVHRKTYEVIWIIAIGFVGPVFGLYLMPKEVDEQLVLPESSTLLARGITFLINFILTPMLIIYLAILHLYAAKILVSLSLPKGQVALMVLTFSLGLTAFVLFARPWVSQCTKLTGWLLQYWHFLLFTPLALLAISVSRRISDYGVTPERYMLVALGLWLLALLIYPLIRKAQLSSVRIISSIATILILVSFGPWGAKGISIASQKNQFVQLLERNGLLESGKLKTDIVAPPKLTPEDVKTGHSIVQFLSRNGDLESIQPIFEDHSKNPFETDDNTRRKWNTVNRLNNLLGFAYNGKHANIVVNYNARMPAMVDISQYSAFVPRLFLRNNMTSKSSQSTARKIQVWRENGKIIIESPKGRFESELKMIIELAKKANEENKTAQENEVLAFKLQSSTGTAMMLINNLNTSYHNDKLQHTSITFDLLIE